MNMNKKQINFFNHCSIILKNFPENNFSVGSKGQPEQSRIQHYTNSFFKFVFDQTFFHVFSKTCTNHFSF